LPPQLTMSGTYRHKLLHEIYHHCRLGRWRRIAVQGA
jgi:hypothetical protein